MSSAGAELSQSAAEAPRVGSIRMSSGPSWRNEKPRAASSICGDEMPRSSRTPSTRSSPRCDGLVVQRGEAAVDDREARIVDGGGRRDGVGVAIEREQAAVGRQPFEDAPTVAAASERAVDVEPSRRATVDREPVDRFVEQHGAMAIRRAAVGMRRSDGSAERFDGATGRRSRAEVEAAWRNRAGTTRPEKADARGSRKRASDSERERLEFVRQRRGVVFASFCSCADASQISK